MTGCAQRTGFLTLTFCGEPAVASCIQCGKWICAGHLQHDPSGPCCPDCAVIGLDDEEASRRNLSSSYYRRDSYDTLGTYSPADYDSFKGHGGEMGGAGASGEWGKEEASGESDSGGPDGPGSVPVDDSDSGGPGDFQDS
jgi:hypothetical protein